MLYENEKNKNISFPLGGIGTGCIGLAGNGELIDWEIFNRPAKNTRNGFSHFAIKAEHGEKKVTKVLHGDLTESLIGQHHLTDFIAYGFGFGPKQNTMAGYPHFRRTSFEATYPIAELTFTDDDFPGEVTLCAFNPFIPHDEDNSGLPAGFFSWKINNTCDEAIEYSLAFSMRNPSDTSVNEEITDRAEKGIVFNSGRPTDRTDYFDLCIATDHSDVDVVESWYRGEWMDAVTTYWNSLTSQKRQQRRRYPCAGKNDHGTVVAYVTVPAHTSRTVRFVLAWNVPNQYNYWSPYKDENDKDVTWKNYYATKFDSSYATAKYALDNFDDLYRKTRLFCDTIKESSLPDYVIDAISANLSVLKSPTVLRLEDGSLWGWEGCRTDHGSCEGSCQHVWNYAYALPFLFPRLERSLRDNTIKYALYPSGETEFRISLPLGRDRKKFRACVDGQMGEIIKLYREWKISGDTEWIRERADALYSMLEFAWSEENEDKWDADCDGVIEGRQHHTLDMELFGPNSWLEGFYLLALDCAAKIAEALGDKERAERYADLYKRGREWTNGHLWNGEYFSQLVDIKSRATVEQFNAPNYWYDEAEEIKYQIDGGCIIDQVLADWHAAIVGVDGVFDGEKRRSALKSIYRNNYNASMRELTNMWRVFSVNDESGTVICSYPEGASKPAIPIPYCEETMTGFEYAAAGLMIASGLADEGEQLVKAIRDRFDGERRNPWNEFECGSNYARSMASFALMPIYSGFKFDMTKGYIGFFPISGSGSYLWSVAESWGKVTVGDGATRLSVLGEPLTVSSFGLRDARRVVSVKVDGKPVDFCVSDEAIVLNGAEIKCSLEINII